MQKSIFLAGEGDAWFERNHEAIQRRSMDRSDPVIAAVARLAPTLPRAARLLEIGCGEAKRLAWLTQHQQLECHGIEPSGRAVAAAQAAGVNALQGTADALPHAADSFDVVVFGFCLYLCDREDLFRIAAECDRVLKPEGWVVIHDFFASAPVQRPYHHKDGVYSYKMDYRQLFDWHPSYTCFAHDVMGHGGGALTDDPQEWVALSVLRKKAHA